MLSPGCVSYEVLRHSALSTPLPTLTSIAGSSDLELSLLLEDVDCTVDGVQVRDFFNQEISTGVCPAIFLSSTAVARVAQGPFPAHLKSVPITTRILPEQFVAEYPKLFAVRAWRAEGIGGTPVPPVASASDVSSTTPLLELPAKRRAPDDESYWAATTSAHGRDSRLKRRLDPVKQIRAIGILGTLRSRELFQECLQATKEYEADVDEEVPQRSTEADPSDWTLDRARARLDPLACALSRRQFATWHAEDSLEAVNVYSDGSPVTGAELQGMIIDCHLKDDTMERITLPGCMLSYGLMNWVAKMMAFVWATFLVVGPDLPVLQYFYDHVRSFTTDYGVEISLALICNILPAFIRWLQGCALPSLKDLVKHSERLMPVCMRIGGWSHSLGNTMKDVCKEFPLYPTYLHHMQKLCSFWRNETYRRHIQRVIQAPRELEVDKKLTSFTASFAKWRYETLFQVQRQLLNLRSVCEDHMRRELLGAVQDVEELGAVLEACKDKAFWRWCAASFRFIMKPLELLRRWGMVCNCHEEERRAHPGRHIECKENSRRLREAWPHVKDVIAQIIGTANFLSVEDTEGDAALHKMIVDACRSVAVLLETRFKYLRSLPYSLARADTVPGATECLEAFSSRPRDAHDAVTINIMDRIGPELEALRASGVCGAGLAKEVRLINTCPLDESCGEGYHRSTQWTRTRAKRAKLPYIMASTRHKENLRRIRAFMKTHGARGRAVIREDWVRYKRVLQALPRRKWIPKRMNDANFFKRFYRMDEKALEDWSSLIGQPTGVPPLPVRVAMTDNDRSRIEYYKWVFKPRTYYSLKRSVERPNADGEPAAVDEVVSFQVVRIQQSSLRPHQGHQNCRHGQRCLGFGQVRYVCSVS